MVQRYKFNCKYRNYLADNFVLGAIIHKICFKHIKRFVRFEKYVYLCIVILNTIFLP